MKYKKQLFLTIISLIFTGLPVMAAPIYIDDNATTFAGYVLPATSTEIAALQDSNKILITFFEFNINLVGASLGSLLEGINVAEADLPVSIIGNPLPYPNPISLSTTYAKGPMIHYYLSESLDIEIRFYDIRGNKYYQLYLP